MVAPYQPRPHSMLRLGKFVFVVYQGDHQDHNPAVVKFKLVLPGVKSEETTPSCSDRE